MSATGRTADDDSHKNFACCRRSDTPLHRHEGAMEHPEPIAEEVMSVPTLSGVREHIFANEIGPIALLDHGQHRLGLSNSQLLDITTGQFPVQDRISSAQLTQVSRASSNCRSSSFGHPSIRPLPHQLATSRSIKNGPFANTSPGDGGSPLGRWLRAQKTPASRRSSQTHLPGGHTHSKRVLYAA